MTTTKNHTTADRRFTLSTCQIGGGKAIHLGWFDRDAESLGGRRPFGEIDDTLCGQASTNRRRLDVHSVDQVGDIVSTDAGDFRQATCKSCLRAWAACKSHGHELAAHDQTAAHSDLVNPQVLSSLDDHNDGKLHSFKVSAVTGKVFYQQSIVIDRRSPLEPGRHYSLATNNETGAPIVPAERISYASEWQEVDETFGYWRYFEKALAADQGESLPTSDEKVATVLDRVHVRALRIREKSRLNGLDQSQAARQVAKLWRVADAHPIEIHGVAMKGLLADLLPAFFDWYGLKYPLPADAQRAGERPLIPTRDGADQVAAPAADDWKTAAEFRDEYRDAIDGKSPAPSGETFESWRARPNLFKSGAVMWATGVLGEAWSMRAQAARVPTTAASAATSGNIARTFDELIKSIERLINHDEPTLLKLYQDFEIHCSKSPNHPRFTVQLTHEFVVKLYKAAGDNWRKRAEAGELAELLEIFPHQATKMIMPAAIKSGYSGKYQRAKFHLAPPLDQGVADKLAAHQSRSGYRD